MGHSVLEDQLKLYKIACFGCVWSSCDMCSKRRKLVHDITDEMVRAMCSPDPVHPTTPMIDIRRLAHLL